MFLDNKGWLTGSDYSIGVDYNVTCSIKKRCKSFDVWRR